jgi:UV DNA damage endonuclease
MRIGFPVNVLGQPGLKAYDNRRWQSGPHLSVSLAYLRDLLFYLRRRKLFMYRMAADLAPYLARPDLPQFARQIDDCLPELALAGELANAAGVRLSFHAGAAVVLDSLEAAVLDRATAYLAGLARLLDAMGLGPEAVVVVHVGGLYGDRAASLARWALRYETLPEAVRRRLALEHDDSLFALTDGYWLHQRTGVPLVFDYLHHLNYNPEGLGLAEALELALSTWPAAVRPKIHFASPRTELYRVQWGNELRLRPPQWTQHADFVNPFEFIALLRLSAGRMRPFDVMIEARGRDLAALRLRADLVRYAPDLASCLDAAPARVAESPEPYSACPTVGEEDARVLVAVMNAPRDLWLAREQGWYRIPLARAPRLVGADYLAFYQTRAFGQEAWAIRYYAPITGYRVVMRRDLLPDEPEHPRARDWYYQILIGSLQRLEPAIPSRRLRRVTFIPTTLSRLLSALEINDLWMRDRLQERLWIEVWQPWST